MNKKRLKQKFFTKATLKIAKDLLGKYIVRKIGSLKVRLVKGDRKKIIGKIVETEAYIGPADRASHAYDFKKTERNKVEYLKGGRIYIYLVYGMYWQLNITTAKKERPECVLIRALEPTIANLHKLSTNSTNNQLVKIRDLVPKFVKISDLANGPGKLCRYLKLNKSFYGENLTRSKRIWLEDWSEKIRPNQIAGAPRIGIDYAGPYWSKKKWRFYIKNNKYISKI